MDHELNEWTSFLDTTVELVSKQSSEVLRATLLSLFATRYSVLNHWQYCECCCKLTHALAHENTQSHFMSKHSPSPQGFMYWVFCCTITRQSDLTPPRHRRAQLGLSNLSGSPRCLVEFHSFRSLINSSFFLNVLSNSCLTVMSPAAKYMMQWTRREWKQIWKRAWPTDHKI